MRLTFKGLLGQISCAISTLKPYLGLSGSASPFCGALLEVAVKAQRNFMAPFYWHKRESHFCSVSGITLDQVNGFKISIIVKEPIRKLKVKANYSMLITIVPWETPLPDSSRRPKEIQLLEAFMLSRDKNWSFVCLLEPE